MTSSPGPDPQPPSSEGDAAVAPVEGPLQWASALRRAGLRVGLLALSFPVVAVLLFLAIVVPMALAGFDMGPVTQGPLGWVKGLLVALLLGLVLGVGTVPLVPLAFVEFLAAQRRSLRVHLAAAGLLLPLSVLCLALMVVQVHYAAAVFEQGSLQHAARRALDGAWHLAGDLAPSDWLRVVAVLLPIPLTSLARMRELALRQQLAWTLAGVLVLAGLLVLLAEGLEPRLPRFYRSDAQQALRALSVLGGALLAAAVLPGAFLRADQAERRVARWLRRDD